MKKIITALFFFMISNFLTSTYAVSYTHQQFKKSHQLHLKQTKGIKETVAETNDFMHGFSGNFTLTSNYVFRGISQTNNNPAVQGGLTYTFPIGFYLNVWASNVDLIDTHDSHAHLEIDTTAGFHHNVTDNFNYDLSIIRNNYPQDRFLNYNEFDAVLKYRIFQLLLAYSSNVNDVHTPGTYINGALIYDIPAKYTLNIRNINFQAGIGHYRLGGAAGNSYDDYSMALTKKINKTYSIMAQWTATNGAKMPPIDRHQIIGSVVASF